MIVFLTKHQAARSIETGRERLTGDLIRVLRNVAETVEVRHVPAPRGSLKKVFNGLRGYSDGASPSFADELVRNLKQLGASTLFVDGSNFGRLVERTKKSLPSLRIITFFHNCEAAFFWDSLKNRRSAKAGLVLLSNYLAERSAVRFSDEIVTLTKRDGKALKSLYGCGETSVFPMFLSRRHAASGGAPHKLDGGEDYVLFVGGAFYANVVGAKWFAREVAPHLGLKTLIVGAGFEDYRSELERHRNVRVAGGVEDVAPYYAGAKLVVAPIFDGSGMKTKVAEALMFGKVVVGTPEALVGYEQASGSVCIPCDSTDEFIETIEALLSRTKGLAREALAFFNAEFSEAAAEERMKILLGTGR
jgi:polysaccharide biosynthesis protein PslH